MNNKNEKHKTSQPNSRANRNPKERRDNPSLRVVNADQLDGRDESTRLYDVAASKICKTKPSWLWPDRLPLGTVAIMQGDKGVGKSTWARAIVAAVTGGPRLYGLKGKKPKPGNVLYYAGEESLETKVRPGLEAAGADLDRVFCADNYANDGRQLQLPSDCKRLDDRIRELDAKLVVIDPIFCFSDGVCDLEGPTLSARVFMKELGNVAQRTNALILLTRNLTKNRSAGALASGRGSGELGNAARSVLHLSRVENQEFLALAVAACNAGRPVPSLKYQIVEKNGDPVVKVLGPIDVTADELVDGERGDLERSQLDKAKELIRSLLSTGRLDSKTIKGKAADNMISERTLQMAAQQLGIRYQREGAGASTVSFWLCPKGGWHG